MFGKYFASTFTGSMVGAGSAVFAVWGYVIANCRDGSVELNPRLLAMILGDTPESIQKAVDFLCAPDEESRTKAHDGRRMLHSGAFLYEVPNHSTYRKILNEDERREYFRIKKQEERQRKKALTLDSQGQSRTVKDMSTVSTQSESESESEKKAEGREPPPCAERPSESEFLAEMKRRLVPEWFAREKFLSIDATGWEKVRNWRSKAGQVQCWYEEAGKPLHPKGKNGNGAPSRNRGPNI